MKALIANGVRTGFIAEKNASLVQIVDLGDEAANNDETRAAEWGPLALKTLQEWTFPVRFLYIILLTAVGRRLRVQVGGGQGQGEQLDWWMHLTARLRMGAAARARART